MKKIVILLVSLVLVLMTCGCQAKKESAEPEIGQLRAICNLATLECHYHNVARSTKEAGKGILHVFETSRQYWVEYTGTAKIGIDISKVKMTISNDVVTIYVPKAELLNINILDSDLNEESVYVSEDAFINKNKITAEEQTTAINIAQTEMTERVNKNTALFIQAQDRAKKLIESYVKEIGKISGKHYSIKWKTEDK